MSSDRAGLPLGITMGDAAGIGPEIILRCALEPDCPQYVVYGSAARLSAVARQLGLAVRIEPIRCIDEVVGSGRTDRSRAPQAEIGTTRVTGAGNVVHRPASAAHTPVLRVIDIGPDVCEVAWGKVDARAGQAAYAYVCAAIDDALAGKLRAVVTAPLNKASMHAAGITFPGHTEILAERSGTTEFAMMLANTSLRVLLVTIHIALADVPAAITERAVGRAIRLAHGACRLMGIAAPRVAVAGLNPHAGESGKFGREEIEVITPAIEQARGQGIDATGPWPGDTVFMRARTGEFDIVVAQYHDQGLIPVKYLGIDEGVNVTVGLPFVRTSVDHGTAFDIAGQGIAQHASLMAAIRFACTMTPALESD